MDDLFKKYDDILMAYQDDLDNQKKEEFSNMKVELQLLMNQTMRDKENAQIATKNQESKSQKYSSALIPILIAGGAMILLISSSKKK